MIDPVIIIGAPRSGTNMLRDALTELSGVGTWPCDEINYIWRHGNVRHPSDIFTAEMARSEVQNYIKHQFGKLAVSQALDVIVEKTCASSLRVGFIDRIFPDAKYVFIVRDGMDVVGSAIKRWTADLDIPYILRKARYVPPTDLPYYALRYFGHRLYRLISKEKRLALWGPAMDNIDELWEKYTLTEVCALQWQACVEESEYHFTSISTDRICRVKYEDFVRQPVMEFSKIVDFLGKQVPSHVNRYLQENISSGSLGKGRKSLGAVGLASLRPLIAPTLDRYGYE